MNAARLWLRALAVAVTVAANVLPQILSAVTDDYGPRPAGIGWALVFVGVALVYVICAVIAWRSSSKGATALLKSESWRDPCGSGFTREADTAVDGTGFARVRG